MSAKTRLKQLEKGREQAKKNRANVTDVLKIRKVDYRTGLDGEPDPPGTLIRLRLIDMNTDKDDDT